MWRMAKLLLNLRSVPDDEADEIRALLDDRNIAFYETLPSFWGVSAGGIWIRSAEDFSKAKLLMAEYQRQRQAKAHAEYQAARREGRVKSVWDSVIENPIQAIALMLGIAFLVLVLALPFFMMGS
jgi:hypothetical protein